MYAIAIDGPAGAGKSTIARRIASQLGWLYVDTGALYRAVGLSGLRRGVDTASREAILPLLPQIKVELCYRDGEQRVLLDGEDVSEAIRRPEMSMAASRISALACVREKMVEMQRAIAAEQSCVLDGRDIGTHVLPDADCKFFITASVDVRAKRRCDELRAKGFAVDFDTVRREIEERDRGDATRAVSPLRQAEDAEYIDTSDLTAAQVVALLKRKIQEKV